MIRDSKGSARSPAAAILVGVLLVGCAGQSWLHAVRGSATSQGEARPSYTATARVKLYAEPDASSAVVAVLDRYERIDRYQSVNGFAFVEAKGNVAGWVPEGQLVERRPVARKPAAEPSTPAEVTEGSPPEEVAEPPDAAASDEAPAPPDTEPTEPERSVFDPY